MSKAPATFWALTPLITFGLATPVTLGWAAARLRSTPIAASAVLYLVGLIVIVRGAYVYDSKPPAAIDTIMTICWLATWFGATVQAMTIRKRVFPQKAP